MGSIGDIFWTIDYGDILNQEVTTPIIGHITGAYKRYSMGYRLYRTGYWAETLNED